MSSEKTVIVLVIGASVGTYQKPISIIDKIQLFENCSDGSFNDSKFMGTFAMSVFKGGAHPVIPFAEDTISPKGTSSLIYALTSRLKGTSPKDYVFKLVHPDSYDPESGSIKEQNLFRWSKANGSVMTETEFNSLDLKPNPPFSIPVKVTCGLVCQYQKNGRTMTGHKTIAFGIGMDEADKLKQEYDDHIGKVHKGEEISLFVNEKQGGSVVKIQSLGDTAHLTVNTDIKSVLSGPLLEKYNANVQDFKLSQIDPNAKTDKNLRIAKEKDDFDVTVTSWYSYLVENR
jgi:hypothetical protein